jgi:hypothetical protein
MRTLRTFSLIFLFIFIQAQIKAQDCKHVCPDNRIVQAESGKEGAVVTFPENQPGATACTNYTYSPASGSFFRLGSHSIIVTNGNGQKCSFTITVTDNESPTLSPITLSREKIWPASNKMKKVKVFYTATDNGENVKTEISVKSNAPEPAGDSEIVDDHLIRLKSSRLADGSPRIYTITVTATDESGNKTTRTTTVAVSETMVAKPVPTK